MREGRGGISSSEEELARFRFGEALIAIGVLGACSSQSSSNDGTCGPYCTDFCTTLVQCKVPTDSSCPDACMAGVGTSGCGHLTPASRYRCAEVQMLYECGAYCVAFCQRIPTCGAFDEQACLTGCERLKPVICNPASVAARTCDQLKPEGRAYDEAAKGQSSFATPGVYGLCLDPSECSPGQACAVSTNTCGPCQTDAECAQGIGTLYACGAGGSCAMVQCVSSVDCTGSPCDVATHTCVECLTSADCAMLPGTQCVSNSCQ
ncbi:MAG: hypothetical protein ACRENE_21870 [Polyangiaceae bacterium]